MLLSYRQRRNNDQGYDNCIVLDMTPHQSPNMTELQVAMKYNVDAGTRMTLRAICVCQYLYTFSKESSWTWHVV